MTKVRDQKMKFFLFFFFDNWFIIRGSQNLKEKFGKNIFKWVIIRKENYRANAFAHTNPIALSLQGSSSKGPGVVCSQFLQKFPQLQSSYRAKLQQIFRCKRTKPVCWSGSELFRRILNFHYQNRDPALVNLQKPITCFKIIFFIIFVKNHPLLQ